MAANKLSLIERKRESAITVVHARLQELQKEHEYLEQLAQNQIGTEIPKTFVSLQNNMIIDPSNVGTTTLDRMIKTDDTINSAVHFKILMILSKIGEYHHKNPDIKKFVQNYLNDMSLPNWESAIESMLSCHGYKFSVSEIVYGLNGVAKVPKKIVTYNPATIAFEVDDHGEITEDGILQYTQQRSMFSNINNRFNSTAYGFRVDNPFTTPVDRIYPHRMPWSIQIGLVRIPRNKTIHFCGQEWHGFGNPYGNSGVRTAHLLWQLKVFLLKQMGIATKRKAMPKLWGTAPRGAQQVEVTLGNGTTKQVTPVEALRLMLKDLEDFDSLATGPETEGYKITALADTADLTQFIDVLNALDVRMFRCFLLPSLVMTDGAAGSRSLGDKHFQIVDRIAESDAQKTGEGLIRQMIRKDIIDNFGEQVDGYGSFQRRPQSVEERQRLGMMFGQLGNDGWMSPALESDMSLVREQLHLTPIQTNPFDSDEAAGNINGDLKPGEKPPEGSPVTIGTGVDDNHQDSAFNGAQVTSLVDLVKQVASNQLPGDAAIEILIAAFRMSQEQAKRIVDAAVAFEPAPEPGTNPDPVPGTDPEPKDDPPPPDEDKEKRLSRMKTFLTDELKLNTEPEAFAALIESFLAPFKKIFKEAEPKDQ